MFQIPSIKEMICYVCGGSLTKRDSVEVGGGVRRHLKCKAGSRRWLKQQAPRKARLPKMRGKGRPVTPGQASLLGDYEPAPLGTAVTVPAYASNGVPSDGDPSV